MKIRCIAPDYILPCSHHKNGQCSNKGHCNFKGMPLFTKAEIETTIYALLLIVNDKGYTLKCRNEAKSVIEKLNNILKEIL